MPVQLIARCRKAQNIYRTDRSRTVDQTSNWSTFSSSILGLFLSRNPAAMFVFKDFIQRFFLLSFLLWEKCKLLAMVQMIRHGKEMNRNLLGWAYKEREWWKRILAVNLYWWAWSRWWLRSYFYILLRSKYVCLVWSVPILYLTALPLTFRICHEDRFSVSCTLSFIWIPFSKRTFSGALKNNFEVTTDEDYSVRYALEQGHHVPPWRVLSRFESPIWVSQQVTAGSDQVFIQTGSVAIYTYVLHLPN